MGIVSNYSIESKKYAPVVVFVYNRADRVQRLINSLVDNPECKHTDLFIFSDGYKNETGRAKVENVRSYINTIGERGLFRSVTVTEASYNKGLANSIIDGVSEVMNKYDEAIIIEDDNTVSPDYLDYMNRALEFYKDDQRIWAISGFSRRMEFPSDYYHDIFMLQRISSYTWASWADRWNKTRWDIRMEYPAFFFDKARRRKFAECGDDRPLMLDAQICNKVNSWAIRFEYSMVQNEMYSILPCVSRAVCNGNDGSGTHSTKENHQFDTDLSDGEKKAVFERIEPDERILREFVKPYMNNWRRRIFGNIDFIFLYYLKKYNLIGGPVLVQ